MGDMAFLNRFGESVSGAPVVREEKWKIGEDELGNPLIAWNTYIVHGDKDGFDITKTPYRERRVLPIGTRILRYNGEGGKLTAPIGTRYAQLAMPYRIESLVYNEYEVIAPTEVTVADLEVEEGIVAPGFNSEGGGIQFFHDEVIGTLVDKKLRRLEFKEWSANVESMDK